MKTLKNPATRGLALVMLFVCALELPAATSSSKKKGSSTVKTSAPATASGTRKSSASAAVSRKGGSARASTSKSASRGKGSTSASRSRTPSGPPRQNTPTADRYREIQRALIDRGYSEGNPDGVWGPQWVDSLRRFQADQSLEADGKLGALSLIALGLGPKRQTLQLPPPTASNQTMSGQQLLAKPVE